MEFASTIVSLDRIDGRVGYVLGNVVAACTYHNVDRGLLAFDEYFQVIRYRQAQQAAA